MRSTRRAARCAVEGLESRQLLAAAPSALVAKVPEAAAFQLVYDLNIPKLGGSYNTTAVPYSVNDAAKITTPFDRVAYHLQLTKADGTTQWVYVSADAFTQDAKKLGVPTFASGGAFQNAISNLNVKSNVAGIVQGTGLSGGMMEFWPNSYNTRNAAGVPGASEWGYDFGDEIGLPANGYGSMQIHNYNAQQTLFAYNAWGGLEPTKDAEIGIGNSPTGGKDWTFNKSAGQWSVRRLQVLVRPTTTVPPTSPPPVSPPPVSPPPVSPPVSPPVAGGTRINFQPAAAPTVSGYLVDAGQTYGARNGRTYGWSVSHADAVYDRNVNANQLLDTAVGVKAGGKWELAVPNGKYVVKIAVGDAAATSQNNVWVEGSQLFNQVPLAINAFSTKSVTVNVTDGNLSVGVGSAATGKTKLNYIEVAPSTTPAPTIQLGTILPLGDSITWGYEDKKLPTGGYRSRLYDKLAAAGAGFTYAGSENDPFDSSLQAPKLTRHEGHGAFRTDQVAGNLLGVAPGSNVSSNNGGHWLDGTASHPAINPQIVLLHIGTNDILQKIAPATAAANLDSIIKTLTDARPTAKIFVSTIIPTLDATKMTALKQYNDLLKQVVAKYKALGKKVTLVDMYTQFVDATGAPRASLFSDSVHPTRAGYDKIGDAWSAAILAA
ncbi:SGNH/GDSL hydrolase family protein [Humisphaera borealis]|uniref:SGNH hydrolase-type esterase domain-containing protein n=1 Tax=Humisphaera borealis TaxID=2807512 RepID=A0A7M2WXV4_9BACT|nr:SGNH/GDSL hydrolase family protein [Humisphaera borealis]QOV90306.1 hypothetical protein IPV69_02730 [Humisphaera borealis]